MIEFNNEINIDSFEEIFLEIENTEIRNMKWEKKKRFEPEQNNCVCVFVAHGLPPH